MTNNNQNNLQKNDPSQNPPGVANIKQRKRISPFWLLPFIALCIGGFLYYQLIKEQGETIKIFFTDGAGIVADKTQVRYQGLQVGVVRRVNFTDNLKNVEVTATIYPEAATILRKNTKFWLVQPSASLAGISGIDALVSGNYITLQPGDGSFERTFFAASEGPITQMNDGDLLIHLISDDLGSITTGASVYFKKVPVGTIYAYRFTPDQKKVEIDIVIDKSFASLIKKDSHFWNISGINADISLSGISIEMESLSSIVQGAVAFDSPTNSPPAKYGEKFTLYPTLKSAQRGIIIDIAVPNVGDLEANKTPVYYQNLQVGLLSSLTTDDDNPHDDMIQGQLLIDPNMRNILNAGSEIVVKDRKSNLSSLEDIKNLFRGRYFEIIAGKGELKNEFTVIKESELLLKQPNTLILTLTSPETYSINEGQSVYYHDIAIGEVVSRQITVDGVTFTLAIMSQFSNLINESSKFVAASNLDVSLGVDGVRFQAASPNKWLRGGIRVISTTNPKGDGQALKAYPLYANVDNAEIGITNDNPTPTITLTAKNLPDINKGSVVLFRQYQVGQIVNITPTEKAFTIDVFISPKYQNLLTSKSRFWVESAAQIDISAGGINFQASPLGRVLKGAISFDNISHASSDKTLYPSEIRAKSAGQEITLTTDDASALSKGMPLRYKGIKMGEVETINLQNTQQKITIKALIDPQYLKTISKKGSIYRLITPEISGGGIANLNSLLQPYIDVEPGSGQTHYQFELAHATAQNQYTNGFPLILEGSNVSNVVVGSPVLYRGVEIGMVKSMDINELGDRVLVRISMDHKYRYLVRQNTEFWVSSGYSYNLDWGGFSFNTGTVQQLLKGGITFSTPSGKIVQPIAQPNQRFLLQRKLPDEAPKWSQGALPAN